VIFRLQVIGTEVSAYLTRLCEMALLVHAQEFNQAGEHSAADC
jgi:hypothetical protein